VGDAGFSVTVGGGLAISPDGVFYSTPIRADFGTYDPNTGAFNLIATPSSYPAGSSASYSALAFDGNTLYGINLGTPPHLVTFDTAGNVTDIGTTPLRIDGIAFRPSAVTPPSPTLSINRAGNSVLIQWVSSSVFRLQQNSNLLTTSWVDNTNTVSSSGATNQVVVSPTNSSRFFRLIFP
jgi:hypothetical protein